MEQITTSDRTRSIWLLAVLCVAALWIDFGRLHDRHDADSLLPVLVSLQHWTPFFWGQDRFGMLVPLLALPFRHPLANLLVQDWLTTAFALGAPFLAALYFDGGGSWMAAGWLANAFLLSLLSPTFQFDWLVRQPYAISLSLSFAGLLVMRRPGAVNITAGVLLLVLAHWVNLAVALVIIPSVLVAPRRRVDAVLAAAFAVLVGYWIARTYGAHARTIVAAEFLPVAEWPVAALRLLQACARNVQHAWLLASIAIAALGATIISHRTRRQAVSGAAARLCLVAVVYWLAIATLTHVQLNLYFPRYMLPSVMLVGTAMAIAVAAMLPLAETAATAGATLVCAVCVFAAFGLPSVARLTRTLDRNYGALTSEVIETGATAIVGGYWTVWPAVFHANLVLRDTDARPPIWGVTFRSEVTDSDVAAAAELRSIVLVGQKSDPTIRQELSRLGIATDFLGYREQLELFATRR